MIRCSTMTTSDRAYPERGLHGWVVHAIGTRILTGQVGPGEALPNEADLCAELAVSRSVVREAIKVLAGKGLIEVRPRTGTRVRSASHWHMLDPDILGWLYQNSPSPADFDDLTTLRVVVEPGVARLAALRADDGERRELAEHYAEMERMPMDLERFIAADLAFHEAIFRASRNRMLQHVNQMVRVALDAGRHVTVHTEEHNRANLPVHRRVLDAIVVGHGVEAEAAMRELVEGARADTYRMLRHETPSQPPAPTTPNRRPHRQHGEDT
jgi:DNA-binding FadR family transcriptional regulator